MEYVMVPVPEEYREDVERFLQRKRGGDTPLFGSVDVGIVEQLLQEAGEPTRTLLAVTAQAALTSDEVMLCDLAVALGRSELEILGMAVDLNNLCARVGGPAFAIMPTRRPAAWSDETADDASDETWVVLMAKEMAEAVEAASGRQDAATG